MTALARTVLAHRRLVLIAWLVLAAAGFASLSRATGALSQEFSVPGREGWETAEQIERIYGSRDLAPIVPVLTLPRGTTVDSPGVGGELRRAFSRLADRIPRARIASFASTGDRLFVSADGRTTFALVYPPVRGQGFDAGSRFVGEVERALAGAEIDGARFQISGRAALQEGGAGRGGLGVLAEALIGGAGALLVLIFVFASPLALVPLLMAVAAIPTTYLLVWALTSAVSVSFIIQFLVALLGLGVAIDYALLIVTRWREERDAGLDNDAAVTRALETAGSAVVLSGTTVAIGLLALVTLPLPFIRSLGYGGMLIPLVSVAVALTLLPALLGAAGPRLDRRRLRRSESARRHWESWARVVVRRRWVAAGGALAVLGVLAAAAFTIRVGDPKPDASATSGRALAGLKALERSGVGSGPLSPYEALVRGGNPQAAARTLELVEGVRGAVAPETGGWRSDGAALVPIVPAGEPSGETLDRLRSAAHEQPGRVTIGGAPAVNADFVSAVYGSFPLMIALIALVTVLLLARAFRSLLLPLKAVLLAGLSVAGAWGVLVLVWQQGYGSELLWDIPATGAITSFVPVMVFAFLFGLSMDYEVFMLARMREEYDQVADTDRAVVRGIGRTGRLVTSAGLILFLAFAALASAPDTDVKIIATGLGAGILLDATVIRALLVPAVVSLFGRWNWWLPRPAARLLRVPAAAVGPPAEAERAPEQQRRAA